MNALPPSDRCPLFSGKPRGAEDGALPRGWDSGALCLPDGERVFAMKVNADSMVGKHILPGDVVVIERGAEPEPGEVVAVLVDGKSALRTFVRHRGQAFLRADTAESSDYASAGGMAIQGVMRVLLRHSPRPS